MWSLCDRPVRRETAADVSRARRSLLAALMMVASATFAGPLAAAPQVLAQAQPAPTTEAGRFEVGDVVVLDVAGVPALSDTFQVRDGLVLQLPNIPPLSLAGVRRADVQTHLSQELGRYLVNPAVRAYALVRLAVMGAVEKPGYYVVRSDAPLNDAVMLAGGLTREANPDKISVRRGGQTVIEEGSMRSALAMGATVETLQLHTGDQITIKERRHISWMDVARNGAFLAGAVVSLYAGRAIF